LKKKGSNFFIERLNDNLLFNLYGALKTKLAQKKFLNEITIEIDNFIFKFELLKYEIPSRPNLSWVTIQDLEKIYENEVIQPIVDLKIIMGLLPNTVLHLSFLR